MRTQNLLVMCIAFNVISALPIISAPINVNSAPTGSLERELESKARYITVKILAGNGQGSGVIFSKQNKTYFVISNDHVVKQGKPLRVVTNDGKTYSANQVTTNFQGEDLALIQFVSDRTNYYTATISDRGLSIGDRLFASGFPAETDRWKFTQGRATLFSPQPLKAGYQIGYTNKIQKGMSGGPVLDRFGNLVAINGMHANPIWGDPYSYKNGERPCLPIRQHMREVSWAIPLQRFLSLAPNKVIPSTIPTTNSEQNQGTIFEPYYLRMIQINAAIIQQCNPPFEVEKMRIVDIR